MSVPITISAVLASESMIIVIALVAGYWFSLIAILKNPHINTQEKILWFLVITLAPVIGLIAFWYLDPLPTQPLPSKVQNSDTAS